MSQPMTKKALLKAISDCTDDDGLVFFTDESGDTIGFITDAYVSKHTGRQTIWVEITVQAQR